MENINRVNKESNLKSKLNRKFSTKALGIILGVFLLLSVFTPQSAQAGFNYMFFSVNGDTTVSVMTQGDAIGWGSNSELGATMQWEIWYDVNTNSIIDPATDVLVLSEHWTDGSLISDDNSTPDGWIIGQPFNFGLEPGDYIFKVTDLDTDSSLQKIATSIALASPANQFTGQIILPGVTPPSTQLANIIVTAVSDTLPLMGGMGITDNNGNYTINFDTSATGIGFMLETEAAAGFVVPNELNVTATGGIINNDFTYITPVDSVWGFVKDENGTVIPFESDVRASSSNFLEMVTTQNGRYVIYFSSATKGDWKLNHDSRNSPYYLTELGLSFSHDTVGSFQHDITLTKSDAFIYAKISENGGLPSANYRINASSSAQNMWAESVSGIGADNVVKISVSTLDATGWDVEISLWDFEYPTPTGLILTTDKFSNVSLGDTVLFDFISGHLVSGIITLDPGDGAITWDSINVNAGNGSSSFSGMVQPGGAYSLFTSTGTFSLSPFGKGYITNPTWRDITVTADTTGAGLGFEINAAHSTVSGTLTNVSLPLDNSFYQVFARTGTDGTNGYYVSAFVDSVTGKYTFDLCDGNWTIVPPGGLPDVKAPDSAVIAIAEAPVDTSVTVDFVYSIITGIEDETKNIPASFALNQNYPNPFNPSTVIPFALPTKSTVKIIVYNALGQKVKNLVNAELSAGIHSITWDGTNEAGKTVSTGMYLYKIIANDFVASKKMLLMK